MDFDWLRTGTKVVVNIKHPSARDWANGCIGCVVSKVPINPDVKPVRHYYWIEIFRGTLSDGLYYFYEQDLDPYDILEVMVKTTRHPND